MGWGIEAMTWCANAVGSLPGAVGHIREIPAIAFTLMLAGGMWLALWQTRMRLLGAALILLGLLVAPWMPRPDIMIAQNGTLVAVRDASGKLSALPVKGSKYDLERWLEYDGDGRTASEAQRSAAFTCDAVGCIAHVKGAIVAIARHPAAVADDCANADVLVLDMPRPKDCSTPGTVIDVFDRWRNGAHALYLEQSVADGGVPRVRLETVAAHRGERPWSVMPPQKVPRSVAEPALLPKPRILDEPEAPAPGEQSAVAKPDATAAAAIEAPSDSRSAADTNPGDDPGEDGQSAAGDQGDAQ